MQCFQILLDWKQKKEACALRTSKDDKIIFAYTRPNGEFSSGLIVYRGWQGLFKSWLSFACHTQTDENQLLIKTWSAHNPKWPLACLYPSHTAADGLPCSMNKQVVSWFLFQAPSPCLTQAWQIPGSHDGSTATHILQPTPQSSLQIDIETKRVNTWGVLWQLCKHFKYKTAEHVHDKAINVSSLFFFSTATLAQEQTSGSCCFRGGCVNSRLASAKQGPVSTVYMYMLIFLYLGLSLKASEAIVVMLMDSNILHQYDSKTVMSNLPLWLEHHVHVAG